VTGGEVIGDGPGAWLHGDLRERELSHFAQRESGDDAFESGEEPGEDTRGEEPSEKELRFLKQVNTRAALGADVRAAGHETRGEATGSSATSTSAMELGGGVFELATYRGVRRRGICKESAPSEASESSESKAPLLEGGICATETRVS